MSPLEKKIIIIIDALTVNVNIDVLFFFCRDFGAAAGGDTEALTDGGSQVQDSRSSEWSAPSPVCLPTATTAVSLCEVMP